VTIDIEPLACRYTDSSASIKGKDDGHTGFQPKICHSSRRRKRDRQDVAGLKNGVKTELKNIHDKYENSSRRPMKLCEK